MRLDLFVKLKYGSSTIILFVSIRYSIRDLHTTVIKLGSQCTTDYIIIIIIINIFNVA